MASHRDGEPQDQAVGSVFQEAITSDFLFQAINREAKHSLNCSCLSFGMFFSFSRYSITLYLHVLPQIFVNKSVLFL